MEQHYTCGNQNSKNRNNGSKGFLVRSSHYEEVKTPETNSVVCCMYTGGTNLHNHRIDEAWELTGVPSRKGSNTEVSSIDRHVGSGSSRNGLPRVPKLHSQGSG